MTTSEVRRHEELATALSNGLNHYLLYSADYPAVLQSCRTVVQILQEICEEDPDGTVFIQISGGKIQHGHDFLVGATIRSRRLIDLVRSLSSGGLLFRRGLEVSEVMGLFLLSEGMDGPPRELSMGRMALEQHGVRNIGLASTDERMIWYGHFTAPENFRDPEVRDASESHRPFELQEHIPIFQSMYQTVEESMSKAASGEALDMNEARTAGEQMGVASSEGDVLCDLFELAQYPDYDTYTVGHSIRVALYAVALGTHLGAPPEVLCELGAAALLHDVGKAKIPYEILYKCGRLDAEERGVIMTHASIGAQILLESEEVSRYAIGAAWGHHLRHDSGGYPTRYPWCASTNVTSMLQVCDVFEALTAARPYKPALSARRAYEIMLSDRRAFDPAAFSAFMHTIGIYPPGTYVLLSDGTAGRVLAAGEVLDRPRIRRVGETQGFIELSETPPEELSVVLEIPETQARCLAQVLELPGEEQNGGSGAGPPVDPPVEPPVEPGAGSDGASGESAAEGQDLGLPEWPPC